MQALIAEITDLHVPDLPEYERDEVAFEDDLNTSFYEVLAAYDRTLRCLDLMWQHHFEFLLLGYGAYMTFSELCKSQLPDIPDQHVAQMIAGIDVLLFKPSAELRKLAKLAIDSGVDGAFVEGRTPAEIDAELAESEAGRAWLEALEGIKDPWFNMATGDGLYHFYRSWYDDPSIAYASVVGHVRALRDGEEVERPTEELARERDRLAEEYGALLDEDTRKAFQELLMLSRTVFPYVEEHKFFCDYWFLTRWWNKVREFGALLARARLSRGRGGCLPARSARGGAGARRAGPHLGHGRRRPSDPRTGRRSSPDARSSCGGSASGPHRPRSVRRRRRSPTRP